MGAQKAKGTIGDPATVVADRLAQRGLFRAAAWTLQNHVEFDAYRLGGAYNARHAKREKAGEFEGCSAVDVTG